MEKIFRNIGIFIFGLLAFATMKSALRTISVNDYKKEVEEKTKVYENIAKDYYLKSDPKCELQEEVLEILTEENRAKCVEVSKKMVEHTKILNVKHNEDSEKIITEELEIEIPVVDEFIDDDLKNKMLNFETNAEKMSRAKRISHYNDLMNQYFDNYIKLVDEKKFTYLKAKTKVTYRIVNDKIEILSKEAIEK